MGDCPMRNCPVRALGVARAGLVGTTANLIIAHFAAEFEPALGNAPAAAARPETFHPA
jgi:hypothetical protein